MRSSFFHAIAAATALSVSMSALAAVPSADFRLADPAADERLLTSQALVDGYTTLRWAGEGDAALIYRVESAASPDFAEAVVYYEGDETRVFISGLEDGEHYFRIAARAASGGDDGEFGPWSAPAVLRVKHYDLTTAWAFFGVGAVLFASIVGFIGVASVRAERA